MLTADLVRAQAREGRLLLTPIDDATRRRALEIATRYLDLLSSMVGTMRREVLASLDAVPVATRDRKLALGLRHLVEQRCAFEVASPVEPSDLRDAVFECSARHWQTADPEASFDRAAVLAEIAERMAVEPVRIDEALYADLRTQQRLQAYDAITPAGLLAAYELASAQAVLLRATTVDVEFRSSEPESVRRFFRKLKFLKLLFTVERVGEEAYRVRIDGPFSLFRAVTKYGLQMALVLPYVRELPQWRLRADVVWGRERRNLRFELGGEGRAFVDASTEAHPELQRFVERFERVSGARWSVSPCGDLLAVPGLGICMPDLTFRHQDGGRVYLEVLGFWSREAVFRRIELVERGLDAPVVFAVPKKLRVSEEVLDETLPAALYVFRETLQPADVVAKLDAALARSAQHRSEQCADRDREKHARP